MEGAAPACSPGLVPATATPIYAHIEKAHVERSPITQVHDLQQTGDYVALHEAWIQAFTAPGRDGATSIGATTPTRVVSHAQQSPGSAHGASDPDAFGLSQTTWAQSVVQPTEDVVTGRPC